MNEGSRIAPFETELIGRWVMDRGQIRGDPVCERIKWLTEHYLREIAVSPHSGAWETLFEDPYDGRYWERTYAQDRHGGGGPPVLKYLSRKEAEAKYGLSDQSNEEVADYEI